MATTTKTTVSNAKTLNKALLEVFNGVNMGTVQLGKAKELANVAGKSIKLNLGRLEYKHLTKSANKIDFWEE